MKNKLKYIIYIFIVFMAIVLDQFSKFIVQENIAYGESKTIFDNFFSLTYIHNEGAAFGMMDGKVIYLILFSIIVILFILYQFYTYKDSRFMCNSFSLLLGGLLGNFIDRVFLGHVRDFLDFNIFGYNFPVFNVADICICVSVLFIIYGIMMYEGGMLYGVKDNSDELRNGTKIRSISNRKVRDK